jgi:hypothetical protein
MNINIYVGSGGSYAYSLRERFYACLNPPPTLKE